MVGATAAEVGCSPTGMNCGVRKSKLVVGCSWNASGLEPLVGWQAETARASTVNAHTHTHTPADRRTAFRERMDEDRIAGWEESITEGIRKVGCTIAGGIPAACGRARASRAGPAYVFARGRCRWRHRGKWHPE